MGREAKRGSAANFFGQHKLESNTELLTDGLVLYLLGHATFPSTLENWMENVHQLFVSSPKCL